MLEGHCALLSLWLLLTYSIFTTKLILQIDKLFKYLHQYLLILINTLSHSSAYAINIRYVLHVP